MPLAPHSCISCQFLIFLPFLPQTAKRELGGGCGLAQVLAVTS